MAQKEEAALVEANGSLPIPSGSLQVIPEGIDITTVVAGSLETTITAIRIQLKGTSQIYEYADENDNYNWDGKNLSAYDFIRIPDRYRLYSINVNNQVKGVLENSPALKIVV